MRSVVAATDIDVLPIDHVLIRRTDHWAIRSPSNPAHFWGNWLLYDAPPQAGDRERWLADFDAEFPHVAHRTFSWDTVAGELGDVGSEFADFEVERLVGLLAAPAELNAHPRANAEVAVRPVDPDDDPAWEQVAGLWEAQNAAADDPHPVEQHRAYAAARLADLRELFRLGRGAWYGAYEVDELVGSLGVVVTEGRARYQQVDTLASHRGRGIASRLVFDAAQLTLAGAEIDSFVIVADAEYHALGIYESLGFRRAELVTAILRRPPAE